MSATCRHSTSGPALKSWAEEMYGREQHILVLFAFAAAKWNRGEFLDQVLYKLVRLKGIPIAWKIQELLDENRNTLFHVAARHGHHEIIDRLLTHCRFDHDYDEYELGARPLCELNNFHETPLDLAERHNHRYAASIIRLEIPDHVLKYVNLIKHLASERPRPRHFGSPDHMRNLSSTAVRAQRRRQAQLLPRSKFAASGHHRQR